MAKSTPIALDGHYLHPVYSPHGAIEGVMLAVEGQPVQVVFERHDEQSPLAFAALSPGQHLLLEALPQGPSLKGPADQPVFAFGRLKAVDGRRPAAPKARSGAAYVGTVVRLNHARHGAANGVVLDSGDFIHTKPDGMARLKLKVGDLVRADGDAQMLSTGQGWAVEAQVVNGKRLQP